MSAPDSGDRARDELADLVAAWRPLPDDDPRTTTLAGEGDEALAESWQILAGVAAFGGPGGAEGSAEESAPDDAPLPDLGPFEPIERIGSGGMGDVWLARQAAPLDRVVAVKRIRAGLDSERVLARFDGERAALARMEHPNVATVLDAGITGDGRPYFAMTYVRGVPITDYCDERRLGLRERLQLFRPVCDAIQHAHHRGIIHRDVKPSNILVEEIDGMPVPRVIDFGIAKSTSTDLDEDDGGVTEIGQLVGTPEYMSPEQAEFTGRNVDARADIYALGVVLYELLGGALPFDPATLRAGGLSGIHRTLTTVDPPRLGAHATETPDAAPERGLAPAALARALRGDLEWICHRAMEKDPDRRYRSAAELADDVTRHLRHEPIAAGPPGAAYRIRKFVRRRRGLVTAAAVVAAILVAGIAATSWQAIRARRAEADALLQAETARRVNAFLTDMLADASPQRNPDAKRLTLVDALDRAVADLEDAFPEQPAAEARIRAAIAETYGSLGRYEDAERQYARAFTLGLAEEESAWLERAAKNDVSRSDLESAERRSVAAIGLLDPDDEEDRIDLADRTVVLAIVRYKQDRMAEMDSLFQRSFDLVDGGRDALLRRNLTAAHWYSILLRVQGKLAEAESLAVDTVARIRAERGANDPNLGRALAHLGELHLRLGRPREAESSFREAEEVLARIEGISTSRAMTVVGVGQARQALGDYAAAESLLTTGVAMMREATGGADHLSTAATLSHLGSLHHSTDDLEKAEAEFREAYEMGRRLQGDGVHLWSALNNLAAVTRKLEKWDEAERLFRQSLVWAREIYGEEHFRVAVVLQNLAGTVTDAGRPEEGEPLYRDALRIATNVLPEGHPNLALIRGNSGDCLRQQGRWDEAEAELDRALAGAEATLGPEHPRTARIARWRVAARERNGARMP